MITCNCRDQHILASRQTFAVWSWFLLLLATPSLARASTDGKEVEYTPTQYFDFGKLALKVGKFEAAFGLFARSYAADHDAFTLYKMAVSKEAQFNNSRDPLMGELARFLFLKAINDAPSCSNLRKDTQGDILEQYREDKKHMYCAGAQGSIESLTRALAAQPEPSTAPVLPKPDTQLMVSCQSPGALVHYLGDSRETEPAPAIWAANPGEEYAIWVEAPGYERSDVLKVRAVKETIIVKEVTLRPLPGWLQIQAFPAADSVYIDGIGVQPSDGWSLPPGLHKVALSRGGYELWSGTATVTSQQVTPFVAYLRPTKLRQAAPYAAGTTGVIAAAGIATGIAALLVDASMGSPQQAASVQSNAERAAYNKDIEKRNRFADASTVSLIVAGACLAVTGFLYWALPEPPISSGNVQNSPPKSKALLRDGFGIRF